MALHIYIHKAKAQGPPKSGRKAAGILWFSHQGRILLLKRGPRGAHPGTWAFPAGGIEPGESAIDAACRELWEETFCFNPPRKDAQTIWADENFTLFMVCATEFTPLLNAENDEFMWASPHKLPKPLHPHVQEQVYTATALRKVQRK